MRAERGMTLVEVLVALAILGAGGSALVAVAIATMGEERHSLIEERTMSSASRLLAATSLLTRPDLNRRLGERTVGEYVLAITRPEPVLYRVTIAERSAPEVELLTTVLYRREEPAP